MGKAQHTRAAILHKALRIASGSGLQALSIGRLATEMKMSKSGVFAHFGSSGALHDEVLAYYRAEFERRVLTPVRQAQPGLPALRLLFEHGVQHVGAASTHSCFYFSCAAEYDDRPGPLREQVKAGVRAWRAALLDSVRQAIALGHLPAGADAEQLVFEIYGLLLALQHDARLLDQPECELRAQRGFDALLERRAA